QLGTAVDFTNSAAEYRLWWPFGDTTGRTWLLENAPDYGFVLAYPDGKEAENGYQ
ncbi:MAG: D-alanyl-D-alanine carboxypeptidase family protein, partial [Rubrobacteraceae bacterium]